MIFEVGNHYENSRVSGKSNPEEVWRGRAARRDGDDARGSRAAAQDLFDAGATGVVVKAQIHAGGRGKGGGVKIAKSVEEAGELADKMLGMTLVTHQTGPEGQDRAAAC